MGRTGQERAYWRGFLVGALGVLAVYTTLFFASEVFAQQAPRWPDRQIVARYVHNNSMRVTLDLEKVLTQAQMDAYYASKIAPPPDADTRIDELRTARSKLIEDLGYAADSTLVQAVDAEIARLEAQ